MVTPPVSLSPSSASTFEQCPRRFRYSAIDQIAEPASNATAKGTAVHRSLELLFATVERGQRTRELASGFLSQACEELAQDGTLSSIADFPGLTRFTALAETSLDGYFSMEDPNEPVAIMTETKLTRLLGQGELRGIIDRVDESPDGSISIIDLKTGKP
ncbi:MAG: PD-(D/E)XK nuclease family protein, partial [Actinomycetota bacterium]